MKKVAFFWSSDSFFFSETGFSRELVLKPISVLGVLKTYDKCNYCTDISYVL